MKSACTLSASRKAKLLMLAIAPLALVMAAPATGATQTWDPAQTGGSDGPGSWDLSSLDWTGGAWINGNSAFFGSGGTPDTVTIASPGVSAAGITFNLGYTLAGPGNLTLTGPVTVATGQAATINAPIAGTTGLTLNEGTNTGALTLAGANTYTGATTINSGTLIVGPGGNLGAAANALIVGQSSSSNATVSPTTSIANLTLNTSVTVGSLTSAVNNAANSTIAINGSSILTVNGAMSVGLATLATTAPNIALTVSGNELDLNGNLTVGLNSNGTRDLTTLNMGGLNTFVMNAATGAFNVGAAVQANATLTLALNNTITAASMALSSTTANAGAVNMILGNGTNIINVSNITLGAGKGNAAVKFAAANVGSIVINGTGGPSTVANLTLSNFTSATPNNSQSNLTLATHQATVNAGTVIIGQLAGATGRTANGTITFDTGTFNAQALEMGLDTSGGGTTSIGAIGSFVLGTNAASTGVLNVTNTFWLGSVANTNANATTSAATFTINGGTANIGTNIIVNKGTGTLTGTANSTLNLHAGTLNMSGFAIGSAASPINNVNLAANASDSAILANLGGTGINGAGLTANGAGLLILAGTNSYTGGTTINTTLQVGTATQSGTLPAGTVTNNGALTFAGAGANNITTLTGAGTIAINVGSVSVGDASGYSGAITVNGGTLSGTATLGNVALSGGTLAPGASSSDVTGIMTIGSLTVNSGNFTFNLDTTTSTSISAGTAVFNGTPTFAFNLVGSPTSGQQFTVLTASTLTDNGFLASLAPVSVGRTTFTPSEVGGNSIVVTVSGGPASLVWNGGADGTTWDTRIGGTGGTQNWLNGASQDYFFSNDNVTFNDTNGGHYNVTLSGSLTPGSLTVNNSAGDYTFGGSGSIAGPIGITKSGSGALILANTGGNTYTGVTAIQNGKLVVGAANALPTDAKIAFGDGTGNSGTLDVGGNNVTLSSISENGGSNSIGSSGSTTATITFDGGLTSSTFNGVIKDVVGSGTGKVALSVATGTLMLGGSNTYSGGTTVASGANLTVNAGGSLPATGTLNDAGTVNLANAATSLGSLNGAGTLNLNGTTLTVSNGGSFSGTIADGSAAGNLIASGGSLVLGGQSTYTGTTTIQSGAIVQASHSDSATAPTKTSLGSPTGGAATIVSGGTLDIGGNTANNTLNFGQKTFFVAGTGATGTGAIINTGTTLQEDAFNNITLTGNATFSGTRFDIGRNFSGDVLDLAGFTLTTNMSGAQPIFAILGNTGAGITPLKVTSGQIFVNSGGLDIERNANVPADGVGSQITFNTGTNLELFVTDGTSLTRPMTFLGNNVIGSGNAAVAILASNVTIKGNVTLEANPSGAPSLTANDPISITGNIVESGVSAVVTKAGIANATLSGTNVWTGGTIHTEGTLALGSSTALPTGTALTMGQATTAATLDLGGNNATVGSLALGTGASAVAGTFTVADGTVTSTNTTTLTFTALPSTLVLGSLISGVNIPAGDFVIAINTTAKTVTLAQADLAANGTPLTGVGFANDVIGNSSNTTASTLTYAGGTSTFGGVMRDTLGAGNQTVALNVTSGLLTLSGANTYTGATNISGGELDIGATGSITSTNVSVGTGATLSVIAGGSINSTPNLTNNGTVNLNNPTRTIATLNGTAAGAVVNLNTTSLTISSGGSYAGAINDGGTNGALTVSTALSVGSFNVGTVNANANVQIHGTSKTAALNLTGGTGAWTSGLDLTTSKFILESSVANKTADIGRIRDQVAFGKTNADGIFTSATLAGNMGIAVLDNGVLNKTTFGGVAVDSSSILVGAELFGDANADGHVDLTDLSTVLNNFGTATPAWTSGNFDGAATIDLTDLSAVLNNFGLSNPNASDQAPVGGGAVAAIGTPEPASLAVLGLGAVALLSRRRKA